MDIVSITVLNHQSPPTPTRLLKDNLQWKLVNHGTESREPFPHDSLACVAEMTHALVNIKKKIMAMGVSIVVHSH
jgi:hypothetical protein